VQFLLLSCITEPPAWWEFFDFLVADCSENSIFTDSLRIDLVLASHYSSASLNEEGGNPASL